ncbi:bifunctional precorrin-2 dehydrogenase/sirohydrochlorin ferrochelatase [Crocinitomix catalasitica]|nr:bifunctional precorrin-2 dehydrogenase/sirohydrochlorin ferrochelatase [Crocinitomix catalasitica]
MNELFPIFLKADQLNILLIGGGEVAAEKLHFLLKSSPNAKVQLVAQKVSKEVYKIIENHERINVSIRPFEKEDLIGKSLVIAATNDETFNQELRTFATEKGILLNVADKSDQCDFYLGGIVTKGDLKVAISTNGRSPILAKRFRQFFENEIPTDFERVLDSTSALRKKLNGSFKQKLKQLNAITKNLVENA